MDVNKKAALHLGIQVLANGIMYDAYSKDNLNNQEKLFLHALLIIAMFVLYQAFK